MADRYWRYHATGTSDRDGGFERQERAHRGPEDADGQPKGAYVVAFDAVGAGDGEVVLYVTGSSARQTPTTENRPADATIFAIVDTWEVGSAVKYEKSNES
jgi:hypothetical protein